MTDHAAIAEKLFYEGYNCFQSVFGAFTDVTGLNRETALRLASSLGGGVGRLREMCGALLGAEMVLGAQLGYDGPEKGSVKAQHYARVQELAYRFKREAGSYLCRELLGVDGAQDPVPEERTDTYYAERPCPRLVRLAARLTDEMLAGK